MFAIDWQTVVALGCVVFATAWWVRRAMKWASSDGSCGTGCGHCGSKTTSPDAPTFVALDQLRDRR